MWSDICKSTYVCTAIDGKDVTKVKRDNATRSRNELRRECHALCMDVPWGLRKQDYAKTLVILRGVRKLEYIVRKKMYGVQSKTCCICKDKLVLPIFRHEAIGYHLRCILNWINIGHKFTDPITGKEYTDAELEMIDTLCMQNRLDSDVFELKHDVNRVAEDQDMKDHEERLEIVIDMIERDLDAYKSMTSNDRTPGLGACMVADHFKRSFRELAHLDVDIAHEQASSLIKKHVSIECERLNVLLFEVFENIEEWADEDIDVDDMLDELIPGGIIPITPILNMLFNSTSLPSAGGTITISLPSLPSHGISESAPVPFRPTFRL